MKKICALVTLVAVIVALSFLLASCAKYPNLDELSKFAETKDGEGTIAYIKYGTSYSDGSKYCSLVVLYDETDKYGHQHAGHFTVGSNIPIMREDSREKLSIDDLALGQRIRFTVAASHRYRSFPPTQYGLDRNTSIYDLYRCRKVVILSDGE